MVIKYCRKQPNIQQSRLLSANWKIEPVFVKVIFLVFWSVFCILCIHLIFFHFYIVIFSLLHLAQIFKKRFMQMCQLRGLFRTQSNI